MLTAIFGEDPPDGGDLTELVTRADDRVGDAPGGGVEPRRSPTSSPTARSGRRSPPCPTACDPLLAKPIVQVIIAFVVTAAIVVAGWIAGSTIADGTQSLDDDGVKASLVGVVLLAVGLARARIRARAAHPQQRGGDLAPPAVAAHRRGPRRRAARRSSAPRGWSGSCPTRRRSTWSPSSVPTTRFGRVTGGLYFFAWVAVILVLGIVAPAVATPDAQNTRRPRNYRARSSSRSRWMMR